MKLPQWVKLSRNLKIALCLGSVTPVHAATMEILWGAIDNQPPFLNKYSLIRKAPVPIGLQLPQASITPQAQNTLRFVKGHVDNTQTSHVRYDQYYHDMPVWAAQVIYHLSPNLKTKITGQLVTDIDKDITSLDGKISIDEAKKIVVAKFPTDNEIMVKKIIYLKNKSNKAILAYLIFYRAKTPQGHHALPHFIIDANDGKILLSWNALQTAEIGQGPGGVTFSNLSYRPGVYQFGNLTSGVNALGKINIDFNAGICTIANNLFQVVNLENRSNESLPFSLPISYAAAQAYGLVSFSYACVAPTYANLTDNGFAPINGGLSPINDVTYFIQQTFNMYATQYGLTFPVGTNLPIRIYTHLDDFDNAEACSTACMREAGVKGPQQLTFGNGGTDNAPYSDIGTSGHEFAHLVTDNFSALIYQGQSGGINESFSDMGEFALKSYLRKRYPWIWNGQDWTIGLDISKVNKASRYMNNPPLDGHSIGNAANFVPRMDVHYSSGVFNKAFYLLSVTPGWSVDKSFQIMLDANMHYWIPGTNFNYAACGAIQAAYNRGYRFQDVISAFQNVGVTCLVGEAALMN